MSVGSGSREHDFDNDPVMSNLNIDSGVELEVIDAFCSAERSSDSSNAA